MLFVALSLFLMLTTACTKFTNQKKSEFIRENLPKREAKIQKKHEYFVLPELKNISK